MRSGIKAIIKSDYMTQDERWMAKYNEVMDFIETYRRNPSRHRIEEHDMLNWLKATRKRMNAGELKADRVELFQKLVEIGEKYKHVNQYQ
mgnify:CR=1 FL=1